MEESREERCVFPNCYTECEHYRRFGECLLMVAVRRCEEELREGER